MSKLSKEEKITICKERKRGKSVRELSKKYNVSDTVVKYLTRLVELHGFGIINKKKNKHYTVQEKVRIISRVLENTESVWSIALDEGLPSKGTLVNWVKKYKENGYNIVERKRGRPTMPKKPTKEKKNETLEEKVKRLEEENLYLKAEIEYSKKLRAVVQARKNQQQKKK